MCYALRMVIHTHLNAQGSLHLPPSLLAQAGFTPGAALECEVREGELVVRKEQPVQKTSMREAIERMRELSKGYRFTTEEVMQMTRGED